MIKYTKKDADFVEECMRAYPGEDKKIVADWLVGPVAANTSPGGGLADVKIPGEITELIKLVLLTEEGNISYLAAKSVLSESVASGKLASLIIEEKNLYQVSDADALRKISEEVIKENPKSVQDYKSGKVNAVGFLVGQVMKKSKGKANPKMAQMILKDILDKR